MTTPYIGFADESLSKLPKLGPTASCPSCGKECDIKYSDPPLLQFISCCGEDYLVGIQGIDISVSAPDVSGDTRLVVTEEDVK